MESQNRHRHKIRKFTLLLLSILVFHSTGKAEVILDGTLGRSGSVNGPNYLITSDLGRQVGSNLFHSFYSFNLSRTESATFSGPEIIHNIISRVTGGSASNIDGLLRSTINGANLYLVNPAGMVFGPDAKLDISGSFYAGTADYIRLGDTGRFNARDPGSSVLTVAPPSAFGFLGNGPKGITVKGSSLEVSNGSALSLIGGDINIQGGTLSSASGMINIVSTASAGEAAFDGMSVKADSFSRYGDIRITDSSHIINSEGGAGVFIKGEKLFISNSVVEDVTASSAPGGNISIDIKDQFEMEDSLMRTITKGSGQGGDVSISAGDMWILKGAQIGTRTMSTGNAGDLDVIAQGTIKLAETGEYASALYSFTRGDGNAGGIFIKSADLILDNRGFISNDTYSNGKRGDVLIETGDMKLTDFSIVRGANIMINLNSLEITDGAYIWSPAPGSGDSRSIMINARDSILISGLGENIAPWRAKTAPLYTGIHTDVFVCCVIYNGNIYRGNAGDIYISTPLLRIENSGQIGARTYTDGQGGNINIEAGRVELLSGGEIASDSFGSSIYKGLAGSVTVNAKEAVIISGENGELFSGLSSATRSSGSAGRINVSTPFLSISDSGGIVVATGVFGEGRAGDISINVGKLEVTSGGGITSSSSGYGEEGSIKITASESILLDGGYIVSFGTRLGKAGHIGIRTPFLAMNNGFISTIAYEDHDAGDLTINAKHLSLVNGSVISSESLGTGKAGIISLYASDSLVCDHSAITTAADRSTGGNIDISAGQVQLTGGSQITATVAGGSGTGGNVTINSDVFAAIEDSDITARADQGFGGNITINSKAVILSKDIDLNASSNVVGREGKVEVNAPNIDISGKLAGMPVWFLSADALMPKPCAEREEEASSFVIRGRDGLPVQPDSLLQGL